MSLIIYCNLQRVRQPENRLHFFMIPKKRKKHNFKSVNSPLTLVVKVFFNISKVSHF